MHIKQLYVGVWWQVLFRHWLWYRIIYINVKHIVHIVIFPQIVWVYFDFLTLKQLYTTPVKQMWFHLFCLLYTDFSMWHNWLFHKSMFGFENTL